MNIVKTIAAALACFLLLPVPARAGTAQTYQALSALVADYEQHLVQAINAGRFDIVAPYLLPGSTLHGAQRKLVANLASKGITQKYVHHYPGTLITQSASPKLRIEVHGHVLILAPGKPEREVNYHWIYTAMPRDGRLYLSDIEKADLGKYIRHDTTKAEFFYADELLDQYGKALVGFLNGKAWPTWLQESVRHPKAGAQHARLLDALRSHARPTRVFSLQRDETLDQDEDHEQMQATRRKHLAITYRDPSSEPGKPAELNLFFVASIKEYRVIHDGLPGGDAILTDLDPVGLR